MMCRSHTLLGFLAGAGLARLGLLDLSVPTVAGLVLGSLMPDIDTPFSTIGRALPFVSGPLYLSIGHRSATHSGYGAMAVIIAAYFVQLFAPWPWLPMPAAAFMVGYLTHIAADLLTVEGCALAYPSKRRYCIWPAVQTGGFGELLVVLAIAVPAAYFLAPPYHAVLASVHHAVANIHPGPL
jgi:inner membrane protein